MNHRHVGDVHALGRFEVFLASAVVTVLAVRGFLIVTGYPQVGGDGLHVAHVLWGGLLMGSAIVISVIHTGTRSHMRAAKLGGVGFGLFIDEVGKFVTKDVNYFYRPAVAMIYLTFIVFYMVVREVVLHQQLNDGQRLAIAASAVSDLALGQLTQANRSYALDLLDGVTEHPALAQSIADGLHAEPVQPHSVEGRITHLRDRFTERYRTLLDGQLFARALIGVFVVQLLTIGGDLAVLVHATPRITPDGVPLIHLLADFAGGVSGGYTLWGVIRLLRGDRAGALRVLARSVAVTMLLTQVLVFDEYQLAGLLGVVFEVIVFTLIRGAAEARPAIFHVNTGAAATPTPR